MVEQKGSWFSRFFRSRQFADNEAIQNENLPRAVDLQLHYDPIGTTGTEIYAGYYSEEYLSVLRGKHAADIYDKMRRSDAKVKMCLSAVKNPIKKANWRLEPADDTPDSILKADFIEHVLFKDMDKTFARFLNEALSMVDFGFSLFEVTHKVVMNHPKFGTYNGIRSLGFRSQRTIERWHLDHDTGKLNSIDQYAFGDLDKLVRIPGEFLLVFTLDQEGDNYEGISALRTCYGPWSRKQLFQKLQAIGIEKSAIPTPIATVPEGKENSVQFTKMIEVLKLYTSHQSNYITKPAGWEISFLQNPFDPDKQRSAIEFENTEMVHSFLEHFLELGQSSSGGGSYALSFDQSDFFLSGIEHIANQICEEINMKLIPQIIKLNFANADNCPELQCNGISDKIGKEFAEMLKSLADAKIIIPDEALEDDVRERIGLPAASQVGQRQVTPPQPFGGTPSPSQPIQASEKLKSIELADKAPKKLIQSQSSELETLMKDKLKPISEDLIKKIMKKYQALPAASKINAVKDVSASSGMMNAYQDALTQYLAATSLKAYEAAKKEVPKGAKKLTLAEHKQGFQFAEIDQLPPKLQKKVKTQAQLIAESQQADLEKAVKFQYTSAVGSTDSPAIIEKDLTDAADKYIDGPSITSGSVTIISDAVNSARNDFFFDEQVMSEIESMTFTNPDPVSPICQDLVGTVFDPNDPEAQRYFPPLHHNCKSYLTPNLVDNKNPPLSANGLKPSDPSLNKYVTLSELLTRNKIKK